MVIFFQNWFIVRLVYRAGKWILISFIVCLLSAYLLQLTTSVDQEMLNNVYYQQYQKDYEYIKQEIANAKSKYGIEFKPETINVLKKWHAESSLDQVQRIKLAFAKNQSVSLDTIILQKIIVRNFKHGDWIFYTNNPILNWHYALPNDILNQIYLSAFN